MPTQILTRFTNKRIQLENSYIARQMSLGPWTRLRVLMHWSQMGPVIVGAYPHLTIGLCSGATNVYPNDCHFAGVQTNNSAMWNMQTTYASGFSGTGASTRHRLIQKVGSVESYGADSNNTAGQNAMGGSTYSNNNCFYGLEYEKTSGTTWTLRPFCLTASVGTYALGPEVAIAACEVPYGAFGTVSGHGYIRSAETLTIDEGANGVLDTVNVAWDRSGQYVEILGLYAAILP